MMSSKKKIRELISVADKSIMAEDFESLMDIYTDDAVLVLKPGLNAVGKQKILSAFKVIADYYNHSICVKEEGMAFIESSDTVLVLAETVVSADNTPSQKRKATYVFKKVNSEWKCCIDNSYGHELIQ